MAVINPFLDRADELSGALTRLRHAAQDLWRLIDDCASSLQKIDVETSGDPIKTLRCMRMVVDTTRSFSDEIWSNKENCVARTYRFLETLDDYQRHIDSSAMKYGLNRLPTELLERILFDAANDVGSTTRLSHVCQRFRFVIINNPVFWQRFRLSSSWKDEKIVIVAKRSGFHNLKADMDIRSSDGRPDFQIEDSVAAILSLHPYLEELHTFDFNRNCLEQIRRRLGEIHFPKLRLLSSKWSCNLALLHPQKISEMPSLQILEADFVPHVSQAGSLVDLRLRFMRDRVRLVTLLDFLSSTTGLQKLLLRFDGLGDESGMTEQQDVHLSKLVELSFDEPCQDNGLWRIPSIVARKIRAPSLHKLSISYRLGFGRAAYDAIDEWTMNILSSQSFTELQLSGCFAIDLCRIPPQVEILTWKFTGPSPLAKWPADSFFMTSPPVTTHRLRLMRIYFEAYSYEYLFIRHIRDVLHAAGRDEVQIELYNYHTNRARSLIDVDSPEEQSY